VNAGNVHLAAVLYERDGIASRKWIARRLLPDILDPRANRGLA